MTYLLRRLMTVAVLTSAFGLANTAVTAEIATASRSSQNRNHHQQSLMAQSNQQVIARRRGRASWYGPRFRGQQTASGERFNPSELTAAHRSLPFGTRVRVTNLRNGASVVVRINDRGPYAAGRIIDLSRAAAQAIGVRRTGTAPVRLEVLGR